MRHFSFRAASSFQDHQRPFQGEQEFYATAWKAVTSKAWPCLTRVHDWVLSKPIGNAPYTVAERARIQPAFTTAPVWG